MLVSKKLISSLDPVFKKMSNEDFTSACNRVGIEVEQIFTHHKMENLQIAYIESVIQHPQADKLNVAQVRLSKDEVVTVVCGAENIQAKKYAIYAPIGTAFLDGRVIEEKTIRGIDSFGMLCGYQELTTIGIENMHEDDADGIVILDKAKLGDTHIYKYISNDDVIFDLSIPSNRNDLNSILLLTNEIIFGLQLENTLDLELSHSFKKPATDLKLNKHLATDFGLIYIHDIGDYKPCWHEKQVLMSCGYKVHNNILDMMNIHTICFGNPIHVYDCDQVDMSKISIKQISKETKILALDGKEYIVPEKSIGIYNGNELVNIAGIIGTEASKYKGSKCALVEIANFNPELLKKTAQAMKISTKAQAFFSKQFSSWITQNTFFSICQYFKDKDIKFKYTYNFEKIKTNIIPYDSKHMLSFIGTDKIDIKKNDYLTKDKYFVHPSRIDIQNVYDVYEEIMKIVDINKLEPVSPLFSMNLSENKSKYDDQISLKKYLVNNNFTEVKTYNLSSMESYNLFNFFNVKYDVKLSNPISKKREILRHSLFDEMLKTIQYNLYRKRELQNIFEIQPITISESEILNNLSIVFTTPFLNEKILNVNVPINLTSIKSFIKNLGLSVNSDLSFDIKPSNVSEVYGNQTFTITNGKEDIGYLARVKTNALKKYDIQKDVYICCINLDKLLETKKESKLSKVSEFPTVQRDFNINLKIDSNINDILKEILSIEFVADCFTKDIFLNDNKTIYTFSVKISNTENTLSSKQIDEVMNKINKISQKYDS
ncbi:MAG: phenylalanine--tRNA ligase subunit beta [Mycoplasma sp.]